MTTHDDPGQPGDTSVEPEYPLLDAILRNVVQVDVVLGQATLAPNELVTLTPGQVLVCSQGLHQQVDLVLQGQTVAHGELVTVDGALGVRILSVE